MDCAIYFSITVYTFNKSKLRGVSNSCTSPTSSSVEIHAVGWLEDPKPNIFGNQKNRWVSIRIWFTFQTGHVFLVSWCVFGGEENMLNLHPRMRCYLIWKKRDMKLTSWNPTVMAIQLGSWSNEGQNLRVRLAHVFFHRLTIQAFYEGSSISTGEILLMEETPLTGTFSIIYKALSIPGG